MGILSVTRILVDFIQKSTSIRCWSGYTAHQKCHHGHGLFPLGFAHYHISPLSDTTIILQNTSTFHSTICNISPLQSATEWLAEPCGKYSTIFNKVSHGTVYPQENARTGIIPAEPLGRISLIIKVYSYSDNLYTIYLVIIFSIHLIDSHRTYHSCIFMHNLHRPPVGLASTVQDVQAERLPRTNGTVSSPSKPTVSCWARKERQPS